MGREIELNYFREDTKYDQGVIANKPFIAFDWGGKALKGISCGTSEDAEHLAERFHEMALKMRELETGKKDELLKQGSRRPHTIVIDFDGTIVDHEFPLIGALKKNAKEVITELHKKYEIVISSCRASVLFMGGNRNLPNDQTKAMVKFLDENEIPYDRIDYGDEGKVVAIAYIDDRAVRFNNWSTIKERFSK